MLSKIMVVDEQGAVLHMSSNFCRTEGYDVVEAYSEKDALRLSKKQRPDLILINQRMEGIDIIRLCKTLKDDTDSLLVPVIILTTYLDENERRLLVEIGVDDIIAQPFDKVILRARIKTLLQKKRLTDRLRTLARINSQIQEGLTSQPIQYYTCVISHSLQDTDFAEYLYSRMKAENMRIWYAPEDLKGGESLLDQIDQAIRIFDKVIVVLSEASIGSAWVQTEIRKAWQAERQQGRKKLFPIRLVDFDKIKTWECFDDEHDLAKHIRSLFIPDFANWKDAGVFDVTFAKLLRDLRST